MSRYPGFTCPECGSHYFGTHVHLKDIAGHTDGGEKYPYGTQVGRCHENQYSGNGCKFEWDRSDKKVENKCIYHPTREEWENSYVVS